MFNSITKGDKKKIISFIVLIALCVTMIPIMSLGEDSSDPLDITAHVDLSKDYDIYKGKADGISDDKLIIQDGKLVPSGPSIAEGNDVTVKFYWAITNDNMQYVTAGAYFVTDLPQGAFSYTSIDPNADYSVMANGKEIGTLSITSAGKLKVVFNEAAHNAPFYKNGWLLAEAKVSKLDEGTTSVAIDNIVLPVDTSGGSTSTPPSYEYSTGWWWDGYNDRGGFDKTVGTLTNGKVTYTIYANNDQYKNQFQSKNGTQRDSVVIIDELQEGVKYDSEFSIKTYQYWAKGVSNTEGALAVSPTAMSTSYGDFKTTDLTAGNDPQIKKYTATDPEMSFDDFRAEVEKASEPTYGIWQNKAIVVNVGDLPGSLKFADTWAELKARINKGHIATWTRYKTDGNGKNIFDENGTREVESTTTYQAISPSVKSATLKAYASMYGVPEDDMDNSAYDDNKGSVYGFHISFKTKITGEKRTVSNEAIMYFGGEIGGQDSIGLSYYSLSGGADTGQPGDVELRKYDGATNKQLEGVEFKLQMFNKKTGEYEDLPADHKFAGTHKTSTDGSIMFKEVPYGKYRFVETKTLDGYKDTISFVEGDGTFTVSNDAEFLQFTALNYKEDVKGEEATPTPSSVLGEKSTPDEDEEDGSVLGEEAKTSDMSNLMPILLIMLIALAIVLAASIQSAHRKE